MSKGEKKEQIFLENSGDNGAELGDAAWLWVSGLCRAPARPAASCQGVEKDKGLAGQARKALGLPAHTSCAHCWRPWPCLEGLTCSRNSRPGAGMSSTLSHCASHLLVAGCQEALSSV